MKSKALEQLTFVLRPYRWEVMLAVFLTLLPGYITIWIPFMIGRMIDEGIVAKDFRLMFLYGVFLLGLKSVLFLFHSMVGYCLSAFGARILVDYRDHLLKRVLSYPIHFFDHISAGKLTTRLTYDINSLQELFSSALVPLIGNVFMLLGVMLGMLLINWRLALVSFLIIPVLIWFTSIFHVRIRRRFGFMRQALSALNAMSGESLAGNRDLQSLDAIEANEAEFSRYSKKLQVRFHQAVREYAIYNPTVPLITSMMTVLIIAYGGWQIHAGTMTVGAVVAFLAYASTFDWPIRDFSEKYTVLQQALSAVDRLVELSQPVPEKDEGNLSFSGPATIEYQKVGFRYEKNLPLAVDGLSFSTKPGEKIALLGETGSGKSTTCALLMRFYNPSDGQILLGGRPAQEYSLASYRSRLGWVSQDVVLFSVSLRENLRLFDSRITDDEIWHWLDKVQLKSWVERLPHRLDEVLSERGSSVSSGQRQLLSLARAVLRKPSLLIFDEATAYIDSLTEAALQKAVESLFTSNEFERTTGFFIAHRLSTIRRCDRLLVFKEGHIIEQGSFQELMALNGYARHLYEEQFRRSA